MKASNILVFLKIDIYACRLFGKVYTHGIVSYKKLNQADVKAKNLYFITSSEYLCMLISPNEYFNMKYNS